MNEYSDTNLKQLNKMMIEKKIANNHIFLELSKTVKQNDEKEEMLTIVCFIKSFIFSF